jgi:NADH-quinone oxidoreductase subunit F
LDLHIVGAEPTADERHAVDALLGPPESGWAGGARNVRDTRASHGGLAGVRERRDLLLPALHAVQDRVGWISRGALNYICRRLVVPPAEAWGVVTFYHLFKTEPAPGTVVHVCDDIACRLRGAEEICEALAGADVSSGAAPADRAWAWQRSPCLGQCDRAPAALIVRAGDPPSMTTLIDVAGADDITASLGVRREPTGSVPSAGDRATLAAAGDPHETERVAHGRPAAAQPRTGDPSGVSAAWPVKLLRRVGRVDPASLDSYRACGGYEALARALQLGPQAVIAEVVASNLLGRGGAAFPTGRKWEAVAREPARPRFLVCNADESEPGTFKDRVLLEDDPFALVESMTIAGYATGCERGFIYIRGEYPLARARVQGAIDAARAAGLIGPDILGGGCSFELEMRRGAGAYICGEETALFNSLEGKRGEPRSKPPFPAQVGLFGRPTVVNNVETLVNVIDIVREGGAEWARVGTSASAGTRLFCLSGHVTHPGLYEAPFGITLADLLEVAGGVPHGRPLQAVLLGGAAGTFVGPDALGLRLSFEDVRAASATLGSGVVMVFDDTANLPETLLRIAQFMADESCGQCVPCRVGTVRQVELLQRMIRAGTGAASPADLVLLTELGQAMRDASICGLGQTASSAVESAVSRLRVFHDGGAA